VKSYEPFLPDANAALIVPLRVGSNPLGLLVAESHHVAPFRTDDIDMIVLMTRNLAASINNIRLFEQACFLERTQEDILENASALISAINKDGILTMFNKAFEKFTGYSKKELVGRPVIDVFKRTGREEIALSTWKLLSSGKDLRNQIITLHTKDGKPVKAVFTYTAVHDPRGEVVQYIFVGYDIADREILERQLAQSAKLASLGQMAASIAHELNNPLASISSYAQLLLNNLKKAKGNEKEEQFANKILTGVERIDHLVGKLMDYSRVDSDKKKPLEINNIIENAISFSEFELMRGKIRITRKLQSNLPPVLGSENQLQQVFINLLSNASYILHKQNGGLITIRSYRENDNTVGVDIKDNGPGMSPEQIERIFEPFFTTKPRGEGTGLGLNIVQSIIQKHKGDIKVKSAPGKGSKFIVHLPAYSNTGNIPDSKAKKRKK
jgi:two-component system NtrC family sensor kinase